jgi:hypothetical protein
MQEVLVKRILLAFAVAGFVSAAIAQAPAPTRVRGAIVAIDGNTLTVKDREGRDVAIEITPKTAFAYTKKVSLEDIKPGTGLGTTTVRNAEGKHVAREVHLFGDRPVPNEGSRPLERDPNATMTNARVATTTPGSMMLAYKGGELEVVLPPGIPMLIAVESDRSVLVPGEYASIVATAGADGRLTAARVQTSRDGVRPWN